MGWDMPDLLSKNWGCIDLQNNVERLVAEQKADLEKQIKEKQAEIEKLEKQIDEIRKPFEKKLNDLYKERILLEVDKEIFERLERTGLLASLISKKDKG